MIKKIKTIWKNRSLIWEGFKNFIFKTDLTEDIYHMRMKICKKCPRIDVYGNLCTAPGTKPCCGVCGCSLALKLRSLESECPHPDGPKWKEVKL